MGTVTLEAKGLTKRYGKTSAVDDLSFAVEAGRVTGFLGPNGAGKSTTMRMLLGLDRPDSGSALVHGRRLAELRHPVREVGAALGPGAVHPGRTAYDHLLALAASNRIGRRRVTEVLDITGLARVARRRAGGFSLGMSQRLSIAGALLGDPGVLLFDEPVNGLDPEGVRWVRRLMKGLAAEGRTVFVSSHLMSEMELTADHVVVIGGGRLIADTDVREFIASSSRSAVRVSSPQAAQLRMRLETEGAAVTADARRTLLVSGMDCAQISRIAGECGAELHELTQHRSSLEEAFMELTGHSVEYRSGSPEPA